MGVSRVAVLAAGLLAGSASGQPFAADVSTIDGGGGTVTGTYFSLTGSIGQPDASAFQTGTHYRLAGGFIHASAPPAPCPADLTPPYGLLDLADLVAFVTAFNAMDPLADFVPDGLFALDDVVGFVTAFTAGCP